MAELEKSQNKDLIFTVVIVPITLLLNTCVKFYFINVVETLLKEYKNYINVFLEEKAMILLESTRVMYAIPVKENKKVPYGPIYPLSVNKL